MSSPNNYSQTYLKKINTELNSIINYAKRFYDLNTNPCSKAGTIGKAKAEEMDYWTYDEYIAFREGVKTSRYRIYALKSCTGLVCEKVNCLLYHLLILTLITRQYPSTEHISE